jgi:hypothetical protein
MADQVLTFDANKLKPPKLPELPDSLKARMTSGEIASYAQAQGIYNRDLVVAITNAFVLKKP